MPYIRVAAKQKQLSHEHARMLLVHMHKGSCYELLQARRIIIFLRIYDAENN
jgi:hypothetical protein